MEAQSRASPPASTVAVAPIFSTFAGSTELTEEEAMFLNNLHSLNFPPAEIVRLMHVMRRGRGVSRSQANVRSDADGPPPSYDDITPTNLDSC